MSASQNGNGACPQCAEVPVKGFKFEGMTVCLDPDSLPGGSGVEPGPDNTHLVSRDGALAWDPIAPGGDGVNYSTEEQWTGKLWVDGKKIYQKTVTFEGLPNSTTGNYQHGIEDINIVINISGFYYRDTTFCYPLPYVSTNSLFCIDVKASPEVIQIITGRNHDKTIKVFLTLQYTCTDR